MKSKHKTLIGVTCVIAFTGAIWLGILGSRSEKRSDSGKNLLLVGWDATNRRRISELLAQGKLPNLAALLNKGTMVSVDIRGSATVTKAGWSEMFSGYDANHFLKILDNSRYAAIPNGYTVFERIKRHFGDALFVGFLGAKSNNIGARGPHQMCMNCPHRLADGTKTLWWDEEAEIAPTRGRPKDFEPRDGEPFFHAAQNIDFFKNNIGAGEKVFGEALPFLEKIAARRFFLFVLFEEPHELGHKFGEGSAEYLRAIEQNDLYLGKILDKLQTLGIRDRTEVAVISENGYDDNVKTHHFARRTFLAWPQAGLRERANRYDVAPTILDFFGLDPHAFTPAMKGTSLYLREGPSLFTRAPLAKVTVRAFPDGLSDRFERAVANQYFADEQIEVVPVEGPSAPHRGDTLVQLSEGKIDFALTDEVSLIQAVHAKLPVVALAQVGAASRGAGHVLALRSDLTRQRMVRTRALNLAVFAELRPGDPMLLEIGLQADPLLRKIQTRLVTELSPANYAEALRTGKIDGVFAPASLIRESLMNRSLQVYRPLDWAHPSLAQSLLVTSREFARKNPEILHRFLRAYYFASIDESLIRGWPKRVFIQDEPNLRTMVEQKMSRGFFQNRRRIDVPLDDLSLMQRLLIRQGRLTEAADLGNAVDSGPTQSVIDELAEE